MFAANRRLLVGRPESGRARGPRLRAGLPLGILLALLVMAAMPLFGSAAPSSAPVSAPDTAPEGPSSASTGSGEYAPGPVTPEPDAAISPILPELWRLTANSPDAAVCGTATWVVPTNAPNPSIAISVNLWKGGVKKILDTPLGKLDFGGGNIAYAFCTDIHHSRDKTNARTYCLDGGFFSDWRVAWLVTHYPPTLNDAVQQAARQAAVWRFTDGWLLDQSDATIYNTAYDTNVRNAYNAILASVPAAPPPEYQPGNVQITITPNSATNFLPYQQSHSFTVRLTKGVYPLAGYTVNLSTTHGTLDRISAVTDGNGEAIFNVTSATPGSATLTASAVVDLPAGSRFVEKFSPDTWQRLVLGQMTRLTVQARATKDWVISTNLIIAHKFEDRNLNGVQEEDEPNLPNWSFTLNTPAGQFTTLTDANGNAFFADKVIDFGEYRLTETLQTGWVNSSPLSQTRTRTPADPWTQWRANFGNGQYSVIDILKFLDVDGDGVWDEGDEPLLPGWQFALYIWQNDDWAQHRGGTTGADGRLTFTDLAGGRYKLVEQVDNHPGYINTTPLERELTLGYPQRQEVRFGNRGNLSISGRKFSDLDGDGLWDAGEPALPGWTIHLTGGPHAVNRSTLTDGNGRYTFANLEPGAYTVSEQPQTGWAQTYPAGAHAVTLVDRSLGDFDFGNTQLSCLGDYVWLDLNRNGIQDAGESGVADVRVQLFKLLDGNWVSQGVQTTAGDGRYLFCDLMPGSYYVRFHPPTSYLFTAADQGGDDAKDSDANPATGDTAVIALLAGDNQLQWDAGLYQPPAIDVEKYVSVDDQQSWQDADAPPGPTTTAGHDVYFRFVVTNTGNVPLSNVTLTDTVYNLSGCSPIPNPLAAGASYICIFGSTPALVGQHTNRATAIGTWAGLTVSDADDANYYVRPQPAIDVEKFVSVDGQETWYDADTPPGPETQAGTPVYFRFVVTNIGNVPLSNVTLTDTMYALSGCTIPNPLQPGQSHTCWHGPVMAQAGQHTNTATATGQYDGMTVRDVDDANYISPTPTPTSTATNTPTPTDTPTDTPTPTWTPTNTPTWTPTPTPTSTLTPTWTPTSTPTWTPTHTPTSTPTPIPPEPAIDIEKHVSVDNQITWHDADVPPGPQAAEGEGVYFRFVITNIGNVPLSNVTLSDSIYTIIGCAPIPNPLPPAASYTCIIGPEAAQLGQHRDTATTTGRFDQIIVNDADDANYYVPSEPAIDVEKYVSVDGQATWYDADTPPGPQTLIGAPVYFRFVVTNTGNVPLSDVTLTDTLYTLIGCTLPNPLLPGQSHTCFYGPAPAQAGQHTNTATVTGRYENDTVRDVDDANYIAPTPTPTNTPAPTDTPTPTWTPTPTPTHTPTHTPTSTPTHTPTPTWTPTHTPTWTPTPIPAVPAIDLEKLVSVDNQATWQDADTPPGPQAVAGSAIYFRFIVTNVGNVTLSALTLADNQYTLSGCTLPAFLAPGQSFSCFHGPVTAPVGQHLNTATATGSYGGNVVSDRDDANYYAPTRPAIDLEKYVSVDKQGNWQDADTPPGPAVAAGGAVYFRFVITNVGNVPLWNVTLSDNRYDLSTCDPIPNPLPSGASYSCIIGPLLAEVGQHTNTGVTTGIYENDTPSDSDDANYYAPPRPAIDLEKLVSVDNQATWQDADAPPGPLTTAGHSVYFRFVITNVGNVPLSNVTLTDNVYDLSGCSPIPNPLPPATVYTCTYGPTIAQLGQHTNTARTTGVYEDIPVGDSDDANYNAPTRPDIDVEKYVSVDSQASWQDADISPGPQSRVGDRVFFRFVITNTGGVPLYNVSLGDTVYPLNSCDPIPNPLAPGASYTCIIETIAPDIDGCVHSNTAVARGEYDGIPVRDADDAHYYTPARPAIDVEKLVSVDGAATWHDADAAPGPQAMYGGEVYFRFIIVNVGNVALHDVSLTDSRYPLNSCSPIPNPLAMGASYICTVGPLPAQSGQHLNRAIASGFYGDTQVQDADDANYETITADASIGDFVWRDLDLDGIQDGGEPGIDGVLVDLLDAGNNIIATDVTSGGGFYLFEGLPAGGYQVRVAATNFEIGRPLNGFVFTSAAYGPNPYPVNLGASQSFLFADFGYARARVSILKRASAPQVLPGGLVTYTYEVTNTGDAWLGNLAVTDSVLGPICLSPAIGPLAPGQKAWCQRTTSLDQRTCNTGQVLALATTPAGGPLEAMVQADSAQVCVDVVQTLPRDYGDAPDPDAGAAPGNYQTTAADNGPSHVIIPNLYLGRQGPDSDNGGLQNAGASADDASAVDDEDGLVILPVITTASGAVNVMMSALNDTGQTASLACWIDFNRDGDFLDTGERASAVVNSSASRQSVNLTFSGFAVPSPGVSYLRCRLANAASEVANPIGPATSGEVEDYWLTILNVGACRPVNGASALAANEEPCPSVVIDGLTWLDSNADGIFDEEPALSDVVLSLTNSQGERVGLVTTGPDMFLPGAYAVQDLPPDVYQVTVESWPAGYEPVGPYTRQVSLLSNGERAAVSFPFAPPQARVYLPTLLRGN